MQVLLFHDRVLLTNIRISVHQLEIEKGRQRRPSPDPDNERTCKLYVSGEIEDEKHLILGCKALESNREEFAERISGFTNYTSRDQQSKFAS